MSDKRRDSDGNLYPSTTSSTRVKSGDKVLWNNFQGTKDSHDLAATQMNIKDTKTQEHTYYSPASGPMGVAGGNRDRKKIKTVYIAPSKCLGLCFACRSTWKTGRHQREYHHRYTNFAVAALHAITIHIKLTFHPKRPNLCVAVWALADFVYKGQVVILQNCTTFHTGKFATCFYFWCYYSNEVFYCGSETQIRLVNMVYIWDTVHTSFAKFIVVAHYSVSAVVCVWMPSFKETFQTQLCHPNTSIKSAFNSSLRNSTSRTYAARFSIHA